MLNLYQCTQCAYATTSPNKADTHENTKNHPVNLVMLDVDTDE